MTEMYDAPLERCQDNQLESEAKRISTPRVSTVKLASLPLMICSTMEVQSVSKPVTALVPQYKMEQAYLQRGCSPRK